MSLIIKFHNDIFTEWADKAKNRLSGMKLTILDDGSTDNDNRLGAVKDIAFAINECNLTGADKNVCEDGVLVLAGDNLLDFSIKGFLDFYKEKNATCIMRHYEPSLEKLQRTGVVEVDSSDKVISMEEKPKEPKSNWLCHHFIFMAKRIYRLLLIASMMRRLILMHRVDLLNGFCKKREVYAYEMPGKRYDIGNRESLEWIRKNY